MAFAFIAQDENDLVLIQKLRDRAGAPSPVIMLHNAEEAVEQTELPKGGGVEGWFWDAVDTSRFNCWFCLVLETVHRPIDVVTIVNKFPYVHDWSRSLNR